MRYYGPNLFQYVSIVLHVYLCPNIPFILVTQDALQLTRHINTLPCSCPMTTASIRRHLSHRTVDRMVV
jgi:hypothetical protein